MQLNNDTCYTALRSKDERFDGLFFVGIHSTGIYCRPICPARSAKPENCHFYPSAAAAEKEGFRPCLRCRPELAPGNAPVDMKSRLAASAVNHIEDTLLQDESVGDLAEQLDVTPRHLRRIFKEEFGVSPIEYAQTKRLLLAKHLLTDTRLPVIEVAFASGFSSLRRFNALIKERYRLTPTDIRKNGKDFDESDPITFQLGYRPPLDWISLLDFLRPRLTPGVEAIHGYRYLRTARIDEYTGWFAVMPAQKKPALSIEVSASLVPAIRMLMARVKRMFDLTANPAEIESHLDGIPINHPGLRVPSTFDGFEMAVRAILGQQITVKAATTLSGRFVAEFGEHIETPFDELQYLSPQPAKIAKLTIDDIAQHGIVSARARSIIELSKKVSKKKIDLHPGVDVEKTTAQLLGIYGIGEWTAQYIAMRALAWPDAFPHTDLGIKKALDEENPKKILETAEQWRPWRAYAAMHLWKNFGG